MRLDVLGDIVLLFAPGSNDLFCATLCHLQASIGAINSKIANV